MTGYAVGSMIISLPSQISNVDVLREMLESTSSSILNARITFCVVSYQFVKNPKKKRREFNTNTVKARTYHVILENA